MSNNQVFSKERAPAVSAHSPTRSLAYSPDYEPGSEPERYELDGPRPYRFDFDRRDFCKVLGGGVAVLLLLGGAEAQRRGRGRRGRRSEPQEIGAWLHVDPRGQIVVYTGKVEVGQNIRTSLSQAVAEELRVPIDTVQLVMADTVLTPYDAGTFGSRTTPDMAQRLHRIAAAARELLIDLAADAWSTERGGLRAEDGKIVDPKTGQSLTFGELTQGRKLTQTVADEAPTTPATEWKTAGTSAAKVNARQIVTGRHRYTVDVVLDGMLHGKVLRPASYGAELVSADTSRAQAMDDAVVVRDGDFLAVAAPTEHRAAQILDSIDAQWTSPSHVSGGELFDQLKRTARDSGRGRGNSQNGSISEGLQAADVRLDQRYTIAYIAHAPLEPRAAVARWDGGKLTVWTGTQRPFGVRRDLAEAFRLSENDVRVIVPDTGSGYGGKHTGEAAIEAARLARSAGVPVKVVWTRQEEFTWAYFRPAGVIEVRSGATRDGRLTAWEFHNYNSGGSAIRTPYDVSNQQIEYHAADSPLRQGSYRALASTANVFARESHMNELAHAVGMDLLEFRLKNLTDPRLRAVFEAAARSFGWGQEPADGRGYGIGGGYEKGSYVATCAEVEVNPSTGRVKVLRATSAFDCGAIVNPDHLRNQVEGAMMMGLGGALFEAIEFADGKIQNPRFSRYRVPRFTDVPEIDVVLLDRKDLPSAGAGETPIIGIAPAIAGAIFAATGKRLRSLPMAPGRIA